MVREVTDDFQTSLVTTEVPLHKKLINQVIHNIPTIFTFNSSSMNVKERVTFVLPVSGRLETLRRFLALYEKLCILEEENTRLLVLLYKSDEFPTSLKLLNKLRERHKTEVVIEVFLARTRFMNFQKICCVSIKKNSEMLSIFRSHSFSTDSHLRNF